MQVIIREQEGKIELLDSKDQTRDLLFYDIDPDVELHRIWVLYKST
jgi:hypothetical protein